MATREPRSGLTSDDVAAIAAVRARAAGERKACRRRIERILAASGVSCDVGSLCASAGQAQVTLNFHPDRLIADGRTVAEALRDEGLYRSQFETGISNGGLTAFAGGDRDEWERRLFDGAYHATTSAVEPALRPKYGALNLVEFINGPAPAFGSCALVLGQPAGSRSTFLFGDSSVGGEDLGTADVLEPVLAALLERVAATGQMLGLPRVTVPEAVEQLTGNARSDPLFSRVMDDYIETHTHGPISLATDADSLLLDPSFLDTPTAAALLDAARRYRLSVSWHHGSQLTFATFPTTTPIHGNRELNRWEEFLLSGRGARLAQRVITDHANDHTHLTAAAIGDATRSFLRDPEDWKAWGAPDPSLTVFKDLWRILASHGTPAREASHP